MPTEQRTIVVEIDASVTRFDLARLADEVAAMLETTEADVVVFDVGALVDPDAVTVDALARLALTVRRLGCEIRLRHASVELHELLSFVGLRGALPLCVVLPLGGRGQTEEREQGGGVEEEADPGDLPT